eukprot:TRINITY_DN241_c0_g1_i12.p1 TRINITY_DN241_c0_g1~~TRINITY_DN241_c0_g1_i12.p1  ORF type:complete len:177 (+),score=22.64 TRINITY_DN241_c0_g1_i12:1063-1593(+)
MRWHTNRQTSENVSTNLVVEDRTSIHCEELGISSNISLNHQRTECEDLGISSNTSVKHQRASASLRRPWCQFQHLHQASESICIIVKSLLSAPTPPSSIREGPYNCEELVVSSNTFVKHQRASASLRRPWCQFQHLHQASEKVRIIVKGLWSAPTHLQLQTPLYGSLNNGSFQMNC